MIYKIILFNLCSILSCVLKDIKHLPKLPFFPIVQHSDQRDHNDDRWQGREPLAGGRLAPALLPVQSCSRTQTQISRYLDIYTAAAGPNIAEYQSRGASL